MQYKVEDIPILLDQYIDANDTAPLSLDELEKTSVPFNNTIFNNCKRHGVDRRQLNAGPPIGTEERRGARDRRITG